MPSMLGALLALAFALVLAAVIPWPLAGPRRGPTYINGDWTFRQTAMSSQGPTRRSSSPATYRKVGRGAHAAHSDLQAQLDLHPAIPHRGRGRRRFSTSTMCDGSPSTTGDRSLITAADASYKHTPG